STLVESVPALDEATYRRADSIPVRVNEPAAPSSSGGNFLQDLLDVGTSSSSTDFIKVS
ncbi:hypothetical protein Tco_0035591, partial [Tanacetum coccineum]